MRPESSFGIPYRFSAERVMAADLKEALCANASACLDSLNRSAWRSGEFARTFLTNPRQLFADYAGLVANLTKSEALQPSEPPDDTDLWATPWMYCPSPETMATGVNCSGSITRAQWRASKTRSCPQAIQEYTRGGAAPMASIPVCNIAGSLSNLCQAITQARSLIADANCLRESSNATNPTCAIKEYVYTPATWENSNMAFVHETVDVYYKRMDNCPGRDPADCICPADYNLTLIQQLNNRLLQSCSAQDASAVAIFLTQARALVHPLTQIIATSLWTLLQLVLTLQPGDLGVTARDAVYQGWVGFSKMLGNTMGAVSDIGTNTILMNGAVGPALRVAMQSMCGSYNSAVQYFSETYCTVVALKLPIFLMYLDDIFSQMEGAFYTINDFMRGLINDVTPQMATEMLAMGYTAQFIPQLMATRTSVMASQTAILSNAKTMDGVTNVLFKDEQRPYTKEIAAILDSSAAGLQEADSLKGDKKLLGSKKLGTLSRVWTSAVEKFASFTKVLGYGAMAADVAMGIYQMVEAKKQADAISDALSKLPDTWTAIDFSGIRMVLRNLIDYLNSNQLCLEPPENMQCPVFDLPTGATAHTDAPPLTTQCWADAQVREIGTSNLYACSPSRYVGG